MTSGRKILVCSVAALALAAGPAAAVITPSINYQGFLLSKVTNLPVDTPQDLKFAVYNVPTGGAALFTETRCNVRVSKGRYDVEIGSATVGGIPGAIFMDYNALWLEVQVDADGDCAGAFEPMTPRVKLQASPYSFNSLYASTASAATSNFKADIIGALPQTTYGAITISTNLFVQGGISVGSISPGQKLAVAGVVESTGNWPSCATPPDYTCGFKFPDGSVQVKAAALTMWDVLGQNLYTINEGNTSIGGLTVPSARLHISSATGDTGPLLLVSTGAGNGGQSQLFMVNGNGQVYGNAFYGDGSTLGGVVRKAGDTMTGQLTLNGSSLTVTSALGATSPKFRLAQGVEISSAPASVRGGILLSTHVYLTPGATFYGDGSGLYNITTQDHSKVLKAGDTMTGNLTVANSSITVTGNAFGVTGSTFSIFGGSVAVGGFSYPVRLSVTGGILATSSITAQAGMYTDALRVTNLGQFYNVTAATGTFWSWDIGSGYSVDTASGIKVRAGIVDAPYFVGNGSRLTGVQGTDATRVLKSGDMMTGSLRVEGSSVTVVPAATHLHSFTVNVAASSEYALAVTTGGNVGVRVTDPAAPLEVNERALVSNLAGGASHLDLGANGGPAYLRWTEELLTASGSRNQGVLGYPTSSWDFLYSAGGTIPGIDGQEVFRIRADAGGANWRFGIGTNSPTQRFHVATNMLVSTAATNPIFYISTATNNVGVRTLSPATALDVNGAVTARAGFYGSGIGLVSIPTAALPQTVIVGSITAIAGGAYDGVVFSTVVYASSKLSVGNDAVGAPFDPSLGMAMHVRGPVRLDQKSSESVQLQFYPNFGGDAFLSWSDPFVGANAAMGIENATHDMVYRVADGDLSGPADQEIFRIKYAERRFTVGPAGPSYVSPEPFRVLTNMAVGTGGSAPAFFVSTMATGGFYGSVGVSTGVPKERFHVGSSMLVGQDRNLAVLFVSTRTGGVGVGTGYPQATLDVAGYAQFQSSLTVSGAGLSGTQTAFSVIGSTLIVRNDGRVGIGAASPQATLDVNGSAQFGSGVAKSSMTASGFFVPLAMTSAALQALTPPALGAVVYNVDIANICFSTGTAAAGQWAVAGTKANCF